MGCLKLRALCWALPRGGGGSVPENGMPQSSHQWEGSAEHHQGSARARFMDFTVCVCASCNVRLPFFCFNPLDFANAVGFEVRLPVREHLEARRFIPAQGALYRSAGCPSARLIREVRHHVARAGQRLWRLSFYQKVQTLPHNFLRASYAKSSLQAHHDGGSFIAHLQITFPSRNFRGTRLLM